jgi:hypothetical protein
MTRKKSKKHLPVEAAYTYRWDFYSARLKRLVSGAGTLRLDYFIIQECSPELEHYEPFPSRDVKTGGEVKTIRADAIMTNRDGAKSLVVVRGGAFQAEDAAGDDGARKQWAATNSMLYVEVSTEELRAPNCYLANCYTMYPWLSELHEPSSGDSRAVLGAIAQQSNPVTLEKIAKITGLNCEVVVAVVCRGQVRGIIQIEEIRTRKLDYDSRVSSRTI